MICDRCGKEDRRKYLSKIKGKYYCKKCKVELRKEHRKELRKQGSLDKELKILEKKYRKEHRKKKIETIPKIKGQKKEKIKSNSFITLQEKQNLYRILMRRGLDSEEAKERISELVKYESELRKEMLKKGKSEEEILLNKQRLLEELWNY